MSNLQDVMARAIAAAKEKQLLKPNPTTLTLPPVVAAPVVTNGEWTWNKEQDDAIKKGIFGESFCLIGAAGTGKTTTLRGMLLQMLKSGRIPMLQSATQWLSANTPGVVLLSYTRRAVRNIARQMPKELQAHCLTIHKLLEFAPEKYFETDADGNQVTKMRFVPQRNRQFPLPRDLRTIIIDESSMVSTDLMELLLDALPNRHNVQFIFLGDLNQLPPVYGNAVLGRSLLELPIVELTQVYRQALESPIIALALSVKNNNFKQFNIDAVDLWGAEKGFDVREVKKKITLDKPGRGKVTIQPWKGKYEMEDALHMMCGQLHKWIETEEYLPDEDMVLCPWNKAFGADEMNKSIAQKLSKMRDLPVFEVIAGYNKHYFSVGDKLLVDKQEAFIKDIYPNPKYVGKKPAKPSKNLTRWGAGAEMDLDSVDTRDIDELLENLADVEDRTAESSHVIKVLMVDTDTEELITKSATINAALFAYVITVHKAQGSECRKVFFLTHNCHSKMLFRELVYTGVTRAAEELHVVCSPMMFQTAANRPRIKGDTLAAKLEFYAERLKEEIR